MEKDIRKIFRVGIIGAPTAAEDLSVVARINLLVIIIVFNVFDLERHAKILLPHLSHRGYISADITADAAVCVNDGRQSFGVRHIWIA